MIVSTAAGSSVTTRGHISPGLVAASVARSGGDAGRAITGQGFSGAAEGLTVGGDGGDAGTVTLTSLSDITTAGRYSSAIEARSVTGGGGSAKGVVDASAVGILGVAVTLGGGAGGSAGEVAASSGGTLLTGGHHAYGLHALSLSLGGSGGSAAQASGTGGSSRASWR